jgi:hypothetical protein
MRPPEQSTIERSGAVATTKVRTTIEPGVVREVDDAELVDLYRQGLIHSLERDERHKVLGVAAPKGSRWVPAERGDDIVTAPAPVTATLTDLNTEAE